MNKSLTARPGTFGLVLADTPVGERPRSRSPALGSAARLPHAPSPPGKRRPTLTASTERSAAEAAPRLGPRPLLRYLQLAALAAAGGDRTVAPDRFLTGLRAYWRHPYRRRSQPRRVLWQAGSAQLVDFGGQGRPLLVLPSLINRADVLDLLPRRSLLAHLSSVGVRPLLLDWGVPAGSELRLTIADHVHDRAAAALDAALATTGERPILLGYCLGGLLATALAAAREADLAGLALLATPWSFRHAPPPAPPPPCVTSSLIATLGCAPVDLLQGFFAGLDPLAIIRKYARFGDLDPADPAAELFVAIEDWLNDGVPLAGPVAQECLLDWYGADLPGRGLWAPGGVAVRPERLTLPTLIAAPTKDRIVPVAAALALARHLPQAEVLRPAAGHVSMVVGENAATRLWQPLTCWLRRIAPSPVRSTMPAPSPAAQAGRRAVRALRPIG
jgi:polyhydroxyalkanoate synthase